MSWQYTDPGLAPRAHHVEDLRNEAAEYRLTRGSALASPPAALGQHQGMDDPGAVAGGMAPTPGGPRLGARRNLPGH